MKTAVDILHEALARATQARNADKSAQAKLLSAIEAALAAQREHQAALTELDAAMENMRPTP